MNNPFAPQAMNGVNQVPDGDYVDVDFTYVFDTTPTLGFLELRRDLTVPLHNDADFVLRAIQYVQPDITQLVIFRLRLSDSQGYYLSNSLVYQGNISNDPSRPTPIMPEIVFPRGGAIGLDIENTSPATTCLVQILFRGVKRYRVVR